jgi:protein arginine kinase activator
MMCENCHKESATVFLTQIINGKKIEMHLCSKCASEKEGLLFNNNISFQQFLSGLLENVKAPKNVHLNNVIKCDKCNMTLDEFRKTSKIGCENCYTAFSGYLFPVLKRLHSNIEHTGKTPEKLNKELQITSRIEKMQSDLQIAIMKEDYEEAARLRDLIRDIKKEAGL